VNPAPTLDLAQLSQLGTEGGVELVVELSHIFIEDVSERLKLLEQARAAGDDGALRRLAHRIRGGSGSFGALALAELAADLEAATPGPWRDRLQADLRQEFLRVKVAIEAELATLG
jgi:HPt (histidine-containing phosphotransfer) domain-containing protein